MVFENLCILVLWTNIASALEGLKIYFIRVIKQILVVFNIFVL